MVSTSVIFHKIKDILAKKKIRKAIISEWWKVLSTKWILNPIFKIVTFHSYCSHCLHTGKRFIMAAHGHCVLSSCLALTSCMFAVSHHISYGFPAHGLTLLRCPVNLYWVCESTPQSSFDQWGPLSPDIKTLKKDPSWSLCWFSRDYIQLMQALYTRLQ